LLINLFFFYNTNIGIIYNESNNKQTAKQYVFCKIGILDSKAGTTQIVIIRQLDLSKYYFHLYTYLTSDYHQTEYLVLILPI
jgi:hypothetical protein